MIYRKLFYKWVVDLVQLASAVVANPALKAADQTEPSTLTITLVMLLLLLACAER